VRQLADLLHAYAVAKFGADWQPADLDDVADYLAPQDAELLVKTLASQQPPERRLIVEVQYSSDAGVYAAGLIRNGEPWILGGALVGMRADRGQAVTVLIEMARHLVIEGENGLTDGQVPLTDREWLFHLLDGDVGSHEMYVALKAAGGLTGD
jgi:hypothetical protein